MSASSLPGYMWAEVLHAVNMLRNMTLVTVSLYKIDGVSECPTRSDTDIYGYHPIVHVVKLLSPSKH